MTHVAPERLVQHVKSQLSACVVMLVGTPGSGKSTLAAALARALGEEVAVLSYAALRAEVTGDPADPAGDLQAGQLLRARLAERCAAGLTTIVDGTHHLRRSRDRLRAIAEAVGMPAVAVVLTTSLEVCLARQLGRPAPEPGKQYSLRVPEAQVRDLDHQIQQARRGLTGEGFFVYEIANEDTASGS